MKYFAGIDCGAKTTKVVIIEDGKICAKNLVLSGFDQRKTSEICLNQALNGLELKRSDLAYLTATGIGKGSLADFADGTVTEISADAKGVFYLQNNAKTIIDVGAEEGRAIKTDGRGKVLDFAINEKCAAGAGTFAETMARALEIKIEEIGPISLKSQKSIPMNAQCAVFAESEVVSLIHAATPKEDIARAVIDAIAERIASMTRRVGIEKDIALIGGMALNIGFIAALQRNLELELVVPSEPVFVGALGAALVSQERS